MFNVAITRLFYLLIYCDGTVNEKEIEMANVMLHVEKIDKIKFNSQIESLKNSDKDLIYKSAINDLKQLSQLQQIKVIAWLCVIANADGFMDKSEWELIYKTYHKELKLSLDLIQAEVREINKNLKNFQTIVKEII
jgi:uncharacterized tellurite resistance protein B-like protein